jgi:hypothetical protein
LGKQPAGLDQAFVLGDRTINIGKRAACVFLSFKNKKK